MSAPGLLGPGQVPLNACFGPDGKVLDADGDGLPDCWESNGVDFNGDGVVDLQLCAQVDTNGDGIADATECANPNRKDIFVEIDWMQFHKPDPLALSQAQSVASVGVKSVRQAFAAAAGRPTRCLDGISIHFQVDEQVSFMTLAGTGPVSHVEEIAFTPCTGPQNLRRQPEHAADFDAIKKLQLRHRGRARERRQHAERKRLAFRYVLFRAQADRHQPEAGVGASGCAEVAATTP